MHHTALHFRVSKWFLSMSPFTTVYASTRTTTLMKFCTITVLSTAFDM